MPLEFLFFYSRANLINNKSIPAVNDNPQQTRANRRAQTEKDDRPEQTEKDDQQACELMVVKHAKEFNICSFERFVSK